MPRKRKVVDLDRRGKTMVPQSVLPSNLRREQKRRIRCEVRNEAHHINSGKVDRAASGGLAAEVEDDLRVERERLVEEIDPVKKPGNDMEEGYYYRG